MKKNESKENRENAKLLRIEKNKETGNRLKELLHISGLTQEIFAEGVHMSRSTISDKINGKVSVSEWNAQSFIEFVNQRIKSESEARGEALNQNALFRWEWLCGNDNFKTMGELSLAREFDSPEVTRADQLQWACDILLHEAMSKLNLSNGFLKLEDMESGISVPYTTVQQDKIQERLQEYAESLLAHHFYMAKINQVELACAESRGDTESVTELQHKLEEEI